MQCVKCKTEGKRSQVYPGMCAVTCMGFQTYYDEDGMFHSHDPNWYTTDYKCSEGHEWTTTIQKGCPNCTWARERGTTMTRNTEGKIVPQCEARYVRENNHVRCVKESGHDGDHTDARGEWTNDTEPTPK